MWIMTFVSPIDLWAWVKSASTDLDLIIVFLLPATVVVAAAIIN